MKQDTMDATKLESLIQQVRTEARADVDRVLRQLAHDIITPISTLTMDLFSVRLLLEKMQAAGAPQTAKALSEIAEICANLERAAAHLAEYASFLSRRGSEPPEHDDGLDSSE